jgi:hypothetical protein
MGTVREIGKAGHTQLKDQYSEKLGWLGAIAHQPMDCEFNKVGCVRRSRNAPEASRGVRYVALTHPTKIAAYLIHDP